MLPFRVTFKPGSPVYEQVIYAVDKALVRGQLAPGDPFPSLRTLAKDLQINPNTAQKIVSHLKQKGVLVVEPGRGTFINPDFAPARGAAKDLVDHDLEEIIVKARRLNLSLPDFQKAIEKKWNSLSKD